MASLPRATPKSHPPQLKADARRAESRGRTSRAITLLEEVLRQTPEDWPAVQRLADLRAREGSTRRAVELYQRLAEHYEEDDHLARAIAVWRIVLRHAPEFVGAHVKLGELYERKGFRVESRRHYEAAVAGYEGRGRWHEASLARRALDQETEAPPPLGAARPTGGDGSAFRSPDREEPVEDEDLESLGFAIIPEDAASGDESGAPAPEAQTAEPGELAVPLLFADLEDPGRPEPLGEAQPGSEDHGVRYDVGIAYREMGLLDEAIAELQVASRDPGRLVGCASLLGACFLEKSLPALAVRWLERGLAGGAPSDEARHALQYELGHALEAAGQPARALEVFTELYGEAAGYRDVAARVARLRASTCQTGDDRNVTRGE